MSGADALHNDTKAQYRLAQNIKTWGRELGFDAVGIADTDLAKEEAQLLEWLAQGMHGDMDYMQAHGSKRTRPAELIPGTVSIISVRLNYLPASSANPEDILNNPDKAYIARYALGRDYHRVIRKRLQKLAEKIESEYGSFAYRAFCDSAPVLEKPIAKKAGIGWQGKNTVLIDCEAGSWFFLGELYTNLALPPSTPSEKTYCGSCQSCMDVCPTNAIIAPGKIDARKCIAYLTIEFKGSIPLEMRRAIGNRVFGCDDCQIFCPWNRQPHYSQEPAFNPRNHIDDIDLIELFGWSRWQFEQKLTGSPIRRAGYECWLRNLSVAIGNAPYHEKNVKALAQRRCYPSALVAEHVRWALKEQFHKRHTERHHLRPLR